MIKKLPGVYKILNIVNSKIYIGSSSNVLNRINRHLRDLRSNKHNNSKLQKSWNKYGEESFYFSIIEYVDDKNHLIEREQYYLDTVLHAHLNDNIFENIALNLVKTAGNTIGYNFSEESKSKMSFTKASKSNKFLNIDFSLIDSKYLKLEQELEKKIDTNNPFFGKNHTKDTKYLMSLKKKGSLNPFFGKKGPFSGKKHSDISKHNIGVSNSGPNNLSSKKVLQYDLYGNLIKEWNSTGEVGRELKVSQGNISSCCNYKRKSAYGFIWRYKDSCQ
jgi:group I intron endonuclease